MGKPDLSSNKTLIQKWHLNLRMSFYFNPFPSYCSSSFAITQSGYNWVKHSSCVIIHIITTLSIRRYLIKAFDNSFKMQFSHPKTNQNPTLLDSSDWVRTGICQKLMSHWPSCICQLTFTLHGPSSRIETCMRQDAGFLISIAKDGETHIWLLHKASMEVE